MSDAEKFRETLGKIAHLANDAIQNKGPGRARDDRREAAGIPGCTVKALPSRLRGRAASNATKLMELRQVTCPLFKTKRSE